MNKIKKLSFVDKCLIGFAIGTAFIFGEQIYQGIRDYKPTPQIEVAKQEKSKVVMIGKQLYLVKDNLEEKVAASYPIPDTDNNFLNDSEAILLARAIYGDARGETYDTKVAIAQTILNRTGKNKWWGNTLHEVLLKPKQFSCFNKEDINYPKLQDPLKYEKSEVWQECYDVAEKVLNKEVADISQGATHYCTNDPSWVKDKKPLFTKGRTKFYKLE